MPKPAPWIRTMIRQGTWGKAVADFLMAVPGGIVKNAAQIFEAGMNEEASLVLRAAMEQAMYIFLFTEPTVLSTDPLAWELRPTEKRGYEPLYHKVAGAGILSEFERERLWLVGDHGDTVAHLAERFHKALVAAVKHDTDLDLPYPTRDDVKKNLEAARSILGKFAERLADRIQLDAAARFASD